MNDQQPHPNHSESNGLGLAGFIVSLVGLVSCGLIAPVGLILSLVALGKRPKGFAIAGVIIGLLGSIWFFLAFFVFGLAAIMALVGLGMIAAIAVAAASIGENAMNIYGDIEAYYDANGAAPMTLADIGTYTPAELEDNWGSPIRYQVSADGQEIWLRSDGKDKLPGTSDDFEFYKNYSTDDVRFQGPGVDIGG